MTEGKCMDCGETFVVSDDEARDMMEVLDGDLCHLTKEDGSECEGPGRVTGSWR